MTEHLIWQQNSSNSHNADNLSAIAQWWTGLAGKEVAWQQRLISTGGVQEIDWQPQKFDEKLVLQTPQLKGITIYWRNNNTDERNITCKKLELDPRRQQLYVFPQSQSQVVIKVGLPQTNYQRLELFNPPIAATVKDNNGIILLRDEAEKLEIKVTLDSTRLKRLLNSLDADNQ